MSSMVIYGRCYTCFFKYVVFIASEFVPSLVNISTM
jgi:hypothetical protein